MRDAGCEGLASEPGCLEEAQLAARIANFHAADCASQCVAWSGEGVPRSTYYSKQRIWVWLRRKLENNRLYAAY